MPSDAAEASVPATRAHRERVRAAGQLAPSRTLVGAATILGLLLGLRASGAGTFGAWVVSVRTVWTGEVTWALGVARAFREVAAALVVPVVAALVAQAVVVAWALRDGWPGRREGSAFSRSSWGTGALRRLQQAIVATLVGTGTFGAWMLLQGPRRGALVARAQTVAPSHGGAWLARACESLAVVVGAVLLAELMSHERRRRRALFVSPEEARAERRREQGDPLLRSARRARAGESAAVGKRAGENHGAA